ncbi:hypothetical protein [Leptospira ryugenii]|uniref:hypothetical protein n=1 Tax=Leptospira ryugenii TaxID=1917863 RepID=UPI001AE544F1|nr:hypothetical protein [Leptospira ryugenii]
MAEWNEAKTRSSARTTTGAILSSGGLPTYMLSAVIPSEHKGNAPGGTTDTQCPFGPDEFWLGYAPPNSHSRSLWVGLRMVRPTRSSQLVLLVRAFPIWLVF